MPAAGAGRPRHDAGTRSLSVARVAHAYWLFGNLYEELTRMPDRLADDRDAGRREGLLGSGSPVRYYLPVAPVLAASTCAAVVQGWRDADARRPLAVGAACSAAGLAITGYLVRTVNHRLLEGPPLPAAERARLVTRWHRLNRARLALAATASLALARAGR